MARVVYNERSWAIDVITEINLFIATKSWHFRGAGGESTIRTEAGSLFPDVLIFQDQNRETILHGWELKMPDTLLTDERLISNAITKATILQRDTFILWNVRSAVLYRKNEGTYSPFKTWSDIDINSRTEVRPKENLWKELLHTILTDLNSFFESGEISESTNTQILAVDTIIDVILENIPTTSTNLISRVRENSTFEAQLNNWWLSSATEYGYNPTSAADRNYRFPILSKVVLTDWVFKIIFAHIIKRHFNEARQVESIDENTSITDGLQIISDISEACNFWNIFSNNLALEHISDSAWKQIIQLSQFLSSININAIEVEILQNLLQSSIASAKRKVAGQFSTPKKLAELLVRLTLENKERNVLDPCCGTGTIIHQAYSIKEEYEIPQTQIVEQIWASDKHAFPIQISTMSLAKPENFGQILNIFKSDVIDLETGQQITFKNPNNGNDVVKNLPTFHYIVSNLPFIKSKEIDILNPTITSINDWIQESAGINKSLSGKSDIFAYIPFYLHQHLNENGKIGLILSNAWLGTDYGEIFLELLQKFFNLEKVLISGRGKWFHNAEIVTTILIASKRNPETEEDTSRTISFCTLKERIDEISDIRLLSENIILTHATEAVSIQQYSVSQIRIFETIGLPWCGYFANINWVPLISNKLIDCNLLFNFTRGERRGWNPLFYPAAGHNIEAEYIKPVLRNLRDTASLTCTADSEAFCCSRTIEELGRLNHQGALNWIRSFENLSNETGVPLTQSLQRANMHWYEMKTDNMADFVANVNYDKSLFIAMFNNRSFIDQRMIGLSIKTEYQSENKILFLALLNSVLSMFFIESFGFGRGLGALDLRATKFERSFKILNPINLTSAQKERIINSFLPLTRRNRLPLEQEILQEDRVNFENTLFEIYEISEYFSQVRDSLIHLYKIRFAVKDNSETH